MPASSHFIRRKSVLALLAVAAILAAVLVSAAAAGSSSNGPPQLRVYGGGNVGPGHCTDGAQQFCSNLLREFSLLAIRDPNQDITYGTISDGSGTVIRLTCIAVSGNIAEVAGVTVQNPDPSFVGDPGLGVLPRLRPNGCESARRRQPDLLRRPTGQANLQQRRCGQRCVRARPSSRSPMGTSKSRTS